MQLVDEMDGAFWGIRARLCAAWTPQWPDQGWIRYVLLNQDQVARRVHVFSPKRRSSAAKRRSSAARAPLSRRGRVLIGTTSLIVFLAAWQVSASLGWMNTLFTSSPLDILKAGRDTYNSGTLVPAAEASGKLFLIGFVLAVVIAIPLGLIMGWYRRIDAALDPYVSILYATPRIALIPLILVWFGIGLEARIVIVVTSAVFPLLINTVAGVRATDSQLIRVAKAYSATDPAIFRTVVLPGAVPYIFSGLRQSMNVSLIGVVVAEFFAGNVGLGAMITTAGLQLRTDIAFLGVLVITASALILTGVLRFAEARLTPYRE